MKYSIVIPAHNEAAFIEMTLSSIVQQTHVPKKVVVVNDNSSDETESIIDRFSKTHDFIVKKNITSSDAHVPGSKVVNAFYEGFAIVDDDFDIIVKLDADVILPQNYFEKICDHFQHHPKTGIAGGLAFIEKNGKWVYETVADKNHVRGPFKAYRKACFEQIGGLKRSLGWDTADVLLARYFGWNVFVDETLHVKHLKPTGNAYKRTAHQEHGGVFYKLGYGFWIALISSVKIALKKKNFSVFIAYMNGFLKARQKNSSKMVTQAQAKFIRKFRRRQMWQKITRIFNR